MVECTNLGTLAMMTILFRVPICAFWTLKVKKMKYDLILNEYPQEFVDSIMKPSRINHPFSYTIYQGTAIIPFIQGISDKAHRE
jgi:hypothetical protein